MKSDYLFKGFLLGLFLLLPAQVFAMASRPPVIETGDEPRVVYIGSNEEIITSSYDPSASIEGDAVHTSPGDYVITNNGALVAEGDGIEAEGGSNVIINGILSTDASNDGYIYNINAQQNAILTGDNAIIENFGPIYAGDNGIVAGANSYVLNDGGIDAGIDGIQVGYNSIVVNDEGAEIFSDRTIENGLVACGVEAGSDSDVTNDGFILSDTASGITTYNGSTIENSGILAAPLGNGINAVDNNTIDNTGMIGGDGDTTTYNSSFMDEVITITPVINGIDVNDYNDITNDGIIYAGNTGILAGSYNKIINTYNGAIYSDLLGLPSPATGIHAEDYNEIVNNGLIDSETSNGIVVGYNSTITNNGTINASETEASNGIDGQEYNDITNNGFINAIGPYVAIEGDAHSHGIHVTSNNIVTNYNTITASTAGIEGFGDNNEITNETEGKIFAEDIGISVGDGSDGELLGNTVINKGMIGDDPYDRSDNLYNTAVVSGILAGGPVDVTNSGTIHSTYVGISTEGDGDTVINDGTIYVYGNDAFTPPPGAFMSIMGNAGISVGASESMMVGIFAAPELSEISLEEDTTLGVGSQQAIYNGIINTITNNGTIDAYDENQFSGAAGIRADYNTAITNNGTIDAYSDGIEAGDYNIVHNTEDGVINSDLGYRGIRFPAFPDTTPKTGIDVGDYNIVTNDGEVDSNLNGISVNSHNEVTNNGLIDAMSSGITANDYNIIDNTENGVIYADQMGRNRKLPPNTGISVDDNNEVTNKGMIESFWADGISANDDNTISNYNSIVAGSGAGFYYETNSNMSGIILTGTGNTVTNYNGAVIEAAAFGIDSQSSSETANTINNAGSIVGADLIIAGNQRGGAAGIRVNSNDIVTNTSTGVIGSDGIGGDSDDTDDRRLYGITAYDDNTVTNDGRIDVWSHGIRIDEGNTVVNNGTIYSDGLSDFAFRDMGAGIIAQNLGGGDSHSAPGYSGNTVTNTYNGVILSAGNGIDVSYNSSVTNAGEIDVQQVGILGEDNNEVTNTGSITSGNQGIYVGEESYVENSGDITGNGGIVVGFNSAVLNTADGMIDGGANRGIRTGAKATVTNRGEISGNMGVYVEGYNAAIINSGTITGTGRNALAIRTVDGSEQSITLETGSQVNGNISDNSFGDDDLVTLDGSGQFDWHMNRIEYLNKTGTGTWILTGYNSAGNIGYDFFEVAVKEGALQVDAELSSREVYVWDGATLAGDDDIYVSSGDSFYNGGNVSPGPADGGIGELGIYGTFYSSFCNEETETCSSGNLNIELLDDGEDVLIDKINVYSETTALFGDDIIDNDFDGGTVTAIPLNYIADGTYIFLESDNLLVFEDPTLIDESLLLNFTLDWDEATDEMWLEVTQNTFDDIGGNQNDQNIFDAILEQAEEGDPDAEELLKELVQSDDPVGIMDDLTPEQYPNLLDMSMGGFGIYQNSITGRMGNLHLTHAPQETRKYFASTIYEEGPTLGRIPAFENQAQGWSSWGRVLGVTGDQDGDNGIMGYDFDTYGISFGFDNKVNDTCAFGLGFGMANSDVSFDGGQDTDMDSYHVGLYGTHSNASYYIDGAILFAFNDYDSTRKNSFVNADSSTDGKEWGIYLGGGYKLLDTDSMYFMPVASIEYASVDIDGFKEKGTGGPLYDVEGYDADSFVTTAGFRWGGKLAAGDTRFEPELRVALAREFGDTDRDITASFVGTSTTFTISGVEPNETSVLVGLGANFFVQENLTLFLDYDGEFRDGFAGHSASAGFRYNF